MRRGGEGVGLVRFGKNISELISIWAALGIAKACFVSALICTKILTMSSIKTTQIDGDISVGRNVAMGGKLDIAGNVNVGHNVKINGWLEAANIKGSTTKGFFNTLKDLEAAYPNPYDGWLAGVGSSTPFAAYIGKGGKWQPTGGTISVSVDLGQNTIDVSNLQNDMIEVKKEVEANAEGIKSLEESVKEGTVVTGKANHAESAAALDADSKTREDFLSSLRDDEAAGVITFLKGLKLGKNGKYSLGADGRAVLGEIVAEALKSADYDKDAESGFGLVRNTDGDFSMFLKNITIWGKAVFRELEIRKLSYVGGDYVFSAAGSRIVKAEKYSSETTPSGWKCYFEQDDGETATSNMWKVGDLARCKTFNLVDANGEAANHTWWRRVTEVGTDYFVVSAADCSASENDTPQAGDTCVQFGSDTDEARTNIIIIRTNGEDESGSKLTAPAIEWYHGVGSADNKYSLAGKRTAVISPEKVILKTEYYSLEDYDGTYHAMPIDKGQWDAAVRYYKGNRVTYGGSLWRRTADTASAAGEEPSTAHGWELDVEKGADGKGVNMKGHAVKIVDNFNVLTGTDDGWYLSNGSGYDDNNPVVHGCYWAKLDNGSWSYGKAEAGDTWYCDGDGHVYNAASDDATAWTDMGSWRGSVLKGKAVKLVAYVGDIYTSVDGYYLANQFGSSQNAGAAACVWVHVHDGGFGDGDYGVAATGDTWYCEADGHQYSALGGATAWADMGLYKGEQGEQGIQGIQGEQGEKGDKGDAGDYTEVRYAAGTATQAPSLVNTDREPSGWTTEQPTTADGKYLWRTYALIDGEKNTLKGTWAAAVRITPQDGKTGADAEFYTLAENSNFKGLRHYETQEAESEDAEGLYVKGYGIYGELGYDIVLVKGAARNPVTPSTSVYWRWRTEASGTWHSVQDASTAAKPDWLYGYAKGGKYIDGDTGVLDGSGAVVVELVKVSGTTASVLETRRVAAEITPKSVDTYTDGKRVIGVQGLAGSVLTLTDTSADMSTRLGKAEAKVATSVQYDPKTNKVTSSVKIAGDQIDLEGAITANQQFKIDDFGNLKTGVQVDPGSTLNSLIVEDKSNYVFSESCAVFLPNDPEFIGRRIMIIAVPKCDNTGQILKTDGAAMQKGDIATDPSTGNVIKTSTAEVKLYTGRTYMYHIYGYKGGGSVYPYFYQAPDNDMVNDDAMQWKKDHARTAFSGVEFFAGQNFVQVTGADRYTFPRVLTLQSGYAELLGVPYSVSNTYTTDYCYWEEAAYTIHMARDKGGFIDDSNAGNGLLDAVDGVTPFETAWTELGEAEICRWVVINSEAKVFNAE